MKPWYRSSLALEAHLICIPTIALLLFAYLSGDAVRPRTEYLYALIAFIVAYPILLVLAFFLHHQLRKEQEWEVAQPFEVLRDSRKRWRIISIAYLVIVGAVLTHEGFNGWRINFVPANWLGYFLIGFAVLGMFGVNIWIGGPFDLRLDQKAELAARSKNDHQKDS